MVTLECFGYKLFNRLWLDYGLISKPFPDVFGCTTGMEKNQLNECILDAVKVKQTIFRSFYRRIFDEHYSFFEYSCSEFSTFLTKEFPHNFADCLPMETFLATCAFVAEMCQYCHSNNNDYFLSKSYLIWAHYVEKNFENLFLVKDFWDELVRTCRSYTLPLLFLRENSTTLDTAYGKNQIYHDVQKTVKAIKSMRQFMQNNMSSNTTLAWIDYCLEDEPLDVLACERNLLDLEDTLLDLKQMCDPTESRVRYFDEYLANVRKFKSYGELSNANLKLDSNSISGGEVISNLATGQPKNLATHHGSDSEEDSKVIPEISVSIDLKSTDDIQSAIKSLNEDLLRGLNIELRTSDLNSSLEHKFENERKMFIASDQSQPYDPHTISSSNKAPNNVRFNDFDDVSNIGLNSFTQDGLKISSGRLQSDFSSPSHITNAPNSPPIIFLEPPSSPDAYLKIEGQLELESIPATREIVISPNRTRYVAVKTPKEIENCSPKIDKRSTGPKLSPVSVRESPNSPNGKATLNRSNPDLDLSAQNGIFPNSIISSSAKLFPANLELQTVPSEDKHNATHEVMEYFRESIIAIKTIGNKFLNPSNCSEMENVEKQVLDTVIKNLDRNYASHFDADQSTSTSNSSRLKDKDQVVQLENDNQSTTHTKLVSQIPLETEVPIPQNIIREKKNRKKKVPQKTKPCPELNTLDQAEESEDIKLIKRMILVLGSVRGLQSMKTAELRKAKTKNEREKANASEQPDGDD